MKKRIKKTKRAAAAPAAVPQTAEELRRENERLRAEIELTRLTRDEREQDLLESQQELEASRHRYAELYDSAPAGYLTLSASGTVIGLNLTAAAMLGGDRQFITGHPLLPYVSKADRRKFLHHLARCRRGESPVRTELALAPKGSPPLPVELLGMAVQDEAHHRVWQSVLTDLTERKQAEEALLRREEEYRLLFERNPNPMFVFDEDTLGILAVNGAMVRKYGWTREEFVAMTIKDIRPPPEIPGLMAAVDKQRGSVEAHTGEWLHWRKDGSPIHVEVTVSSLPYAGRGARLVMVSDITERRKAERALRESGQRLAGIVGSAMDAIISVDGSQRIILFNNAAEKIFGWKAGEMIGRSVARLMPLRFYRIHAAHVRNFEATGGSSRRMGALGELSGLRASGEEFPIEASISQVEVAGRKVMTVILRDITERKLAEDSLRQAKEGLELRVQERTADLKRTNRLLSAEMARRERLQSQLLTAAEREQKRIGEDLHDGLCQLITGARFDVATLGQKLRAARPVGAHETDAIEALLKDAVEQARDLSYGLNPLSPDPLGLATALKQLAARMNRHDGPRCVCRIPKPVEIADHAVALQLYRVAQEAVQNALRHARAKNIAVELAQRNGTVTLCVRDDGIGMKDTRRRRGMGLTNMNRRARLIGGLLEIRNVDHHGIAVICRLPRPEKTRKAGT